MVVFADTFGGCLLCICVAPFLDGLTKRALLQAFSFSFSFSLYRFVRECGMLRMFS